MKIITTTYNNDEKNTIVSNIDLNEGSGEMQRINLYPHIKYQRIHGFGGAITDASGYVYSKLSKENQENIIELYYGEEGNGYTMARTHIDSCDFSCGVYTAMDDPEDREMNSFDLTRDEKYILPLLKDAEEKRGEHLDLMLSPWSPPAFMKDNQNRLFGGKLKPEYYGFWAEYICKYITEYQKRGHVVNRLTIQNEPAATQTWDSCLYTAEEEKVFLRDHLFPALQKSNLSHVKINIWDHNKELLIARCSETIDETTSKMIDGIAFHWYSGDHFEALQMTHDLYPDKELIFTEGCVEYSRFGTDQLRNAQMYAHDIIGNLNNGMTGFIDWNILLDKQGGPNHVNNFCDAPIMIDTENDTFEVKLSHTYIGHFSKYIKKGATRIGFSKYTSKLEVTAFQNPDQSYVVVVLNKEANDIPVSIDFAGKVAHQNIPANAIVTFIGH